MLTPVPSFISLKGNAKPATLEEARARREHYESVTRELDFEDRPVRKGYSTNEMWVVFSKVCDKANWKMPIEWKGVLTEEERTILECAVTEFTGGGCSMMPDRMASEENVWVVRARGYYANIGA